MKKIFLLFALTLLTLSAHSAQLLDETVAIAGDQVITKSQLDAEQAFVRYQISKSGTPVPEEKVLRKQVLNHMIVTSLQLQLADRMGIQVSSSEVNDAMREVAARNNVSLEQFKRQIEQAGLSYERFRTDIRDQLITQQVQKRQVSENITVTKQEVDNALKQYRSQKNTNSEYKVSDILISLPAMPSPQQVQQAEAEAKNIIKQLNNGENFQKAAAANSDGEQAFEGGDLGWRKLEELPSIFAEKVKTMQVNDVAGPIRAGNGVHVIKLVGMRGGSEQTHYLTETKVKHILIKTNALVSDEEVQNRMITIRQEILSGQMTFSDAAKKYSEDTSAAQGGELGWVTPGQLVQPFEQAMDQLKPDEISQPVKSEFGWHLIQVEERKRTNDTAEVERARVQQYLYMRKFEEQVGIWLKQLRSAAYVHIIDNQ